MKRSTTWVYMVIGGFLAISLLAGAGFFYLRSEAAELLRGSNAPMKPYRLGIDWMSDGDQPTGKYEEVLADVLGISVEDLRAAYDAVWERTIQAAVSDGKLTEEQSERILERRGLGLRSRPGLMTMGGATNALLAEELGITEATLEAAQIEVRETLLEEALQNGDLSEEQVEWMQSQHALAPYLQTAMAESYENAINEALSDGAITQSQAELLLEHGRPGQGAGFPGRPGMRVRMGPFPDGCFSDTDES